jgi:ABC-2 type transport system permease protein
MEVIAPSPETFRGFFEQQGVFVLFVAVYVGAGLIATDRRVHALQIYLSKPLTRIEYITGKLAILVSLLLLVTWVPAMLLLVVQILFAGDLEFFRENLFLVPAMSTSARFVGVLYVGVLLFTSALATVMNLVTGGTTLSWLSFRANLAQVGDVIFGMSPRYESSWGLSLAVLLCVVVVSALVLERRVRGVEVVT